MVLPKAVQEILHTLNAHGGKAYVVGGCVRDSLRNVPPADFDVATSLPPTEVAVLFGDAVLSDAGIRHGTVMVKGSDGNPVEITTFRTESGYSDNRHPDSVSFVSTLAEDLARRDFTVNAMAYHPDEGLIDPYGGREDIENKRLCCVGNPHKRFEEDSLRILRAARFAAVLGYTVEEKTAEAMHAAAWRLNGLSPERLAAELKKLLCGTYVLPVLMNFSTVITAIIPELIPAISCRQQTPYHCYRVYEHSARATAAVPAIPALRLAALLHDIGKPSRRFTDARGRDHFKQHAPVGADMAAVILHRLRMDAATTKEVTDLIRYHEIYFTADSIAVRHCLARYGPSLFENLLTLQQADCAAKAPFGQAYADKIADIRQTVATLLKAHTPLSVADLAINGNDLETLGVPASPRLGELLQTLMEAVLSETCENSRNALLELVRTML